MFSDELMSPTGALTSHPRASHIDPPRGMDPHKGPQIAPRGLKFQPRSLHIDPPSFETQPPESNAWQNGPRTAGDLRRTPRATGPSSKIKVLDLVARGTLARCEQSCKKISLKMATQSAARYFKKPAATMPPTSPYLLPMVFHTLCLTSSVRGFPAELKATCIVTLSLLARRGQTQARRDCHSSASRLKAGPKFRSPGCQGTTNLKTKQSGFGFLGPLGLHRVTRSRITGSM